MTQDLETRQPTTAAGARGGDKGDFPGLLPATAVAMLSAIVCWIWLISSAGTAMTPEGGGEVVTSELAQVDARDVAAALTTMDGSTDFLTQFKDRATGCARPLAWVTVARAPGQPAGTVRLRSGTYFSPIFDLSDVPLRVAIPYPNPYEAGHGTLTAMEVGGSATVALLPAWHVSAQSGGATREVTWHVSNRCKRLNG